MTPFHLFQSCADRESKMINAQNAYNHARHGKSLELLSIYFIKVRPSITGTIGWRLDEI